MKSLKGQNENAPESKDGGNFQGLWKKIKGEKKTA